MNEWISLHLGILVFLASFLSFNEKLLPSKQPVIVLNMVTDFGAIPNDSINDHEAFERAAQYINDRKGNCKLIIPTGEYIVGKQVKLKDSGYFLKGRDVLMLQNCNNVKIVAEKGAKLRYDVGFYYGSFNPTTESSSDVTWECKQKPFVISSFRADLGRCISLVDCHNISIENIALDGSFYKESLNNMNSFKVRSTDSQQPFFMKERINLGGGYGDCGIQLLHTGISIIRSGRIYINNVSIERFGLDGIYIANSHKEKQQAIIEINKCRFDYNGRTGIAITGGNDIKINQCEIFRTANSHFTATGTGINLEAQYGPQKEYRQVTDVKITRCKIERNSSGEILAAYGLGSSNVSISNCSFYGSNRILNLSSKSKLYKFYDNDINGAKVILYNGVNIIKSNAIIAIPDEEKDNLIFYKNKLK